MLADMNGSRFLLGQASATERLARDRLTYAAWGGRLGLGQYLDRERRLRQTWHARLGMRSWVLKVPNGAVLASCETFRLPLAPAGSVEVIASVFVDRPLRGAGLATRLVDALVAQRREAGIDALVLFTEVGVTLYNRSGFRLLGAPTRTLAARKTAGCGAEPVALAGLPALLEQRARLRTGLLELRLGEELFDWHFERARIYAEALGRPRPESVGARHGDALVLWAPDFKNDRLRILEASGPAGTELGPLLEAAAAEAFRLGLSAAELWDDTHSAQLPGGATYPREDDLPMGLSFTPRGELFLGPLSRATWA
jgi:GNAT superfamily N-acetyltransferase